MSRVTIGRWGTSLAVRLPMDVATEAGLAQGQIVDVSPSPDGIRIRRVVSPLSADDLFAGRSAEAWRSLYEGSYDWGEDIGREIVDE